MEAWAWPYYPLELPDSLIYSYAEMPFGSGTEFPQFSYPEIDLSSLLHESHQPTGSSTHDGLNYYHHHPSTSHAVSDYHSDLPSEPTFFRPILWLNLLNHKINDDCIM
jgi:hypothetical protein